MTQKIVYWIDEKTGGYVELAGTKWDGNASDEELLAKALEEAERVGLDMSYGKTIIETVEEDERMRTWERDGYEVREVEFDYDLHAFVVVRDSGEIVATIIPPDLNAQKEIVEALNAGEGVDSWEDGMGNTITI